VGSSSPPQDHCKKSQDKGEVPSNDLPVPTQQWTQEEVFLIFFFLLSGQCLLIVLNNVTQDLHLAICLLQFTVTVQSNYIATFHEIFFSFFYPSHNTD